MLMEMICCKNYEKMSEKAAQIVAEQIVQKSDSVLGLATGSTPLKIYEILAEKYDEEELDFGSVTTINLDEYKGLSPENKQSYHYYMNYNFFHKVNVNPKKTFIPDGMESDAKHACEVYDQIIRDADILVFPDIHAGNLVYKTIVHMVPCKNGNILTGTKAPVILTSRSDTVEVKINSIALAAVVAEQMKNNK